MIQTRRLKDGQPLLVPGIVPRLSETPGATDWLGPDLGEHTAEVLRGLGYYDERINALRADGVI